MSAVGSERLKNVEFEALNQNWQRSLPTSHTHTGRARAQALEHVEHLEHEQKEFFKWFKTLRLCQTLLNHIRLR